MCLYLIKKNTNFVGTRIISGKRNTRKKYRKKYQIWYNYTLIPLFRKLRISKILLSIVILFKKPSNKHIQVNLKNTSTQDASLSEDGVNPIFAMRLLM